MSKGKFKGKDNLIALIVSKDLKEKVKEAAKAKALNISAFTRLALLNYMEIQNPPARKGTKG